VTDPAAVLSSVRREAWAEKVLQEDYGRLKQEVADEIRRGDKDQALERIRRYREATAAVNRQVGSGRVAANLEQEVGDLQRTVQETFAGAPAAVAAKQQQNAKALHYDGYQKRRDQP
jgi:Ca-activated chloride channel family protein